METFISDLSKKVFPVSEKVSGKSLRHAILQLIQKDHPDFRKDQSISNSELDLYRNKYIESILKEKVGKFSELENKVLTSLKENRTISDSENEEESAITFGQKVADRIASFGGSWTFIIMFMAFLFIWICINFFLVVSKRFDPYPFILLNLILSTLAALQAPVIMMSQNRQEEKDRNRSKKDYMVNLKAEIEVKMLNEKLDHLIISEQQELLEIHKAQQELLNRILKQVETLQNSNQ